MAYSEDLAERVRDALAPRAGIRERKMFGGVAWMLDGNMACGVIGEELIVRLPAEDVESALAREHVRTFDFTGRPMKRWVCVGQDALGSDEDLTGWVDSGADHAASLPAK